MINPDPSLELPRSRYLSQDSVDSALRFRSSVYGRYTVGAVLDPNQQNLSLAQDRGNSNDGAGFKECLHCGNDTKNLNEQFCCLGCAAAYKIINKFGFENYYKLREINPKERKIKPETEEKIDISEFIIRKNDVFELNLMVQGLHCAACVWLIESILKKQENVLEARINLSRKTLFLRWSDDKNKGNELVSIISDIGYKLLPFDLEILAAEEKKYDNTILKALAVAGFGVGNIMLFSFSLWFFGVEKMGVETRNLLHFFSSLIALPVIAYAARPFFSSAIKSVKAGFPNMDIAISIAIFLACCVSLLEVFRSAEYVYFDSAVMLIFFLLIGRYLDVKARKKAFGIATEFSLLAASFGRVLQENKIKILPVKDLRQDMILLVAAGEKIAADGIILEGESEIDTSLITGESLPKDVKKGAEVFAGMINLAATIKVKITKAASNSLLSQIIDLSGNIENKKNHYVRIADRLSKFYLPAVHLLALITFIYWFGSGWEKALMNATAVLIITCPCALALAVPIVQTIIISNFIKKGVLIKSGEALEKMQEIATVVFDKTGSLTVGRPRLKECFVYNELENVDSLHKRADGVTNPVRASCQLGEKYYLNLAASIAVASKHPLSKAIVEAGEENGHERADGVANPVLAIISKEYPGEGLEAVVNGEVVRLGKARFCGVEDNIKRQDGELVCFMKIKNEVVVFTFEDEIKSDAKQVIEQLKQMNKKVILLSGDVKNNVELTAKKLGILEFYFEKNPLQKLQFLEELKNKKENFVMIGDGLNDAPSLALADVSISFSNALDISQNVADVIIQGQKLQPIPDLFLGAKKSIKLMKQNLLIALIYNLIALPFAVAGYVVPLIAAIAMSSSSLLVLFNSLRMNK